MPSFFTTTPTWRSRINTAPSTSGSRTTSNRIKKLAHSSCVSVGITSMIIVFIPISDEAGRRGIRPELAESESGAPGAFAAQRTTRVYDWVNVGVSHQRDPRGSPFQMPTRLADGLGLESDLGHGYPRPFAPSPDLLIIDRLETCPMSGEFGSPASACRKAGQLRLHYDYTIRTSRMGVKSSTRKVLGHRQIWNSSANLPEGRILSCVLSRDAV